MVNTVTMLTRNECSSSSSFRSGYGNHKPIAALALREGYGSINFLQNLRLSRYICQAGLVARNHRIKREPSVCRKITRGDGGSVGARKRGVEANAPNATTTRRCRERFSFSHDLTTIIRFNTRNDVVIES